MEQIPIKQPSKDWPWTLDVDGRPKQSGLDWEAVSRALSGLEKDPDSFVILQQTQGDEYWFMQCAVELGGPCMDKYLLTAPPLYPCTAVWKRPCPISRRSLTGSRWI